MRTGIFGGSFNPIHYGHISLAESAINAGFVDEVMLLVSPQNPLKPLHHLAPEDQRLEMVQRALDHHVRTAPNPDVARRIVASDFEFKLQRPTFTWNTICRLRESFPEKEFSIVIGADNWEIFHRWRNWEEILHTVPVIVYPRQGTIPVQRDGFPLPHILNAPLFPFSSTDIRKGIQHDISDSELAAMVPAAIIPECRRIYSRMTERDHTSIS